MAILREAVLRERNEFACLLLFEDSSKVVFAAPGSEDEIETPAKEKGLADLISWPVSIGYFEPKGGDLTPSYQIDFRLYANGVSRELLIDYGDFSIHGTLTSLEYLKAEACPPVAPAR